MALDSLYYRVYGLEGENPLWWLRLRRCVST